MWENGIIFRTSATDALITPRIMVSFKENALMYSYISYVMNENNLSYSS